MFKTKKISKRTRVKVSRKISVEFNLEYWEFTKLKHILFDKFGLEITSKRYAFIYFKPTCEHKLMLFAIQYSNYIRQK